MARSLNDSIALSVLDAAATNDPKVKMKKSIGILIGGCFLLLVGLVLLIVGFTAKGEIVKIVALIGIIFMILSLALIIPGIIMIVKAKKKIKLTKESQKAAMEGK